MQTLDSATIVEPDVEFVEEVAVEEADTTSIAELGSCRSWILDGEA